MASLALQLRDFPSSYASRHTVPSGVSVVGGIPGVRGLRAWHALNRSVSGPAWQIQLCSAIVAPSPSVLARPLLLPAMLITILCRSAVSYAYIYIYLYICIYIYIYIYSKKQSNITTFRIQQTIRINIVVFRDYVKEKASVSLYPVNPGAKGG